MQKNNGSSNVPSNLKIEEYGQELYRETQRLIESIKDPNSIAVLTTLRGVIALQLGIYRESKGK